MATAETRTGLIGLSVAMLGQAPGTDRLNEWVEASDGGMSLSDLANHIADSDGFKAMYPALLTNGEFAERFLGNVLGDNVSAELMTVAAGIVEGLLNDGMSRGELALAVVAALHDIAGAGEDHPAYADLGMAAMAFANQVEVASHYTLEAGMADPSSGVLAGVTSDDATVATAIRDIDDPPADAMFGAIGELSLMENADGSGMSGDANAPIGVGNVTATDANGDSVAYSIAGDPADWAILEDGKLCYIGTGVDYEEMSSVDLTIVATSIGANGEETSVEQMVTVQIGDVDDLPDEPMQFVLTPLIDTLQGGDADDMFVAIPVAQVSNVFLDVLNPFDIIDGGGGTDTIQISSRDRDGTLTLDRDNKVSNVENVTISTVGGINADLTDWDGVEMVDLVSFGKESDVTVIVDDGAMVSTSQTFGGDVTLVGSAGDVSIKAGKSSEVHIGSAGQTETVTVMGGGNVTIDNGAGKQSQTVTSVSATDVAHNTGSKEEQASGTFVPMTDRDGFVVGGDGSTRVTINTGGTAVYELVKVNDDGVFLNGALAAVNSIDPGDPITVTIASWDHDGDADEDTPTAALTDVIVELKFDGSADGGGIVFGDIVSIGGNPPDADDFPEDVKVDDFNGDALSSQDLGAVTSRSIGREDAAPESVDVGGGPTLTINSDAIADLTLASTTATILVHNNSKTADGKNMPEDLSITLNKYGSFNPNGSSKVVGKLCVARRGFRGRHHAHRGGRLQRRPELERGQDARHRRRRQVVVEREQVRCGRHARRRFGNARGRDCFRRRRREHEQPGRHEEAGEHRRERKLRQEQLQVHGRTGRADHGRRRFRR